VQTFKIHLPLVPPVPLVVSVPHCGTAIPPELIDDFDAEQLRKKDDTDWYVDRLYDFAPSLGATMITSEISRWVIDLNRDPNGKPLYTDGRIITELCPSTDFLGNHLYADKRKTIAREEVDRRKHLYFAPYHESLKELLGSMLEKFGRVILWDCHSIRQVVPTIQKEKFPDLILGTDDQRSASKEVIDVALDSLANGKYRLQHNHPFKGGFITRNYGKPDKNVHALQLEMTKVNYMDDQQVRYDDSRASEIRAILKRTLGRLSEITRA
jgi:N-formylglutamate deformylase